MKLLFSFYNLKRTEMLNLMRYSIVRVCPVHRVRFACAGSYRNVARSPSLIFSRCVTTDSPSSDDSQRRFRGPKSWRHFTITMATGFVVGFAVYIFIKRSQDERAKAKMKRLEKGFGAPAIGGPWQLVDYNNVVRTEQDFLGKWLLIYFGFTHCPDICPEELEKLCKIVTKIDNDSTIPKATPLFFTVDPVRDTPEKLKRYCQEYSPKLLGLGGTVDQVKAVCKTFRVYFGLGPKDPDGDYIVDHTVVIYLIDPEGNYVDHYIREPSADVIFERIRTHMLKYEDNKKKGIKRLF